MNGRTNLIGVITLVAILTGILLYFTNERQNEQILQSYCGDFGSYSKSLILMKDSTFRLHYDYYYGCERTGGSLIGIWSVNDQIISFSTEHPDEKLDTEYQLSNFELIPINEPEEDKFTLCEQYQDPWERTTENENPDS